MVDNRIDREALEHSLELTRDVLKCTNAQVDAHEKKQRLIDIHYKMEVLRMASLKGKKSRVSSFVILH